jgi:hypothetical protein
MAGTPVEGASKPNRGDLYEANASSGGPFSAG